MEDLIPRWAEDLIWVEVDMSVFASNRLNMLEVRVGVYSVRDYQCGLIVDATSKNFTQELVYINSKPISHTSK
jgi:hypothetical protein